MQTNCQDIRGKFCFARKQFLFLLLRPVHTTDEEAIIEDEIREETEGDDILNDRLQIVHDREDDSELS